MEGNGPFNIHDVLYLGQQMADGGTSPMRSAGSYAASDELRRGFLPQQWLESSAARDVWLEAMNLLSPTERDALQAAIPLYGRGLGHGPAEHFLTNACDELPPDVSLAGRRAAAILNQKFHEAYPSGAAPLDRQRFGRAGPVLPPSFIQQQNHAASVPIEGGRMDDEDSDLGQDRHAGVGREEGEPVWKAARTGGAGVEASPEAGGPGDGGGATPGSFRASQVLLDQIAEHGEDSLYCSACDDFFKSELLSPQTEWRWWGAKAQVRGRFRTKAGGTFGLTFYLCANCRRLAYDQARHSVSYLPDNMRAPISTDGFHKTICEGMAAHAATKLLQRPYSDLCIDTVWVGDV